MRDGDAAELFGRVVVSGFGDRGRRRLKWVSVWVKVGFGTEGVEVEVKGGQW